MLQLSVIACLAATAAALRAPPASALKRVRSSRVQRSSQLLAQLAPGWIALVDQYSGQQYYYNEQTGESQWDPPQAQQGYGAQHGYGDQQGYGHQQGYGVQHGYGAPQVLVRLLPTVGVFCHGRSETMQANEYTVRNGQEQVLGRYDMALQNPYISRAHCVVRVAPDGTATISATGKLAAAVRQPGFDWQKVRPSQTHLLVEGHEIALDPKAPQNAIFTAYLQREEDHGQQHAPQGGYYIDDYGFGAYR